jgi:hypothetical protein
MEKKLLGEYLIEAGKINRDQLQRALEIQANSIQGGRMPLLGTVLVDVVPSLKRREIEAALERQELDRTGVVQTAVPPRPTTPPS